MPMRAPKQSVRVLRDGKTIEPPIGEPFEFTDEEVADIMAANPEAISTEAVVDLKASDGAAKSTGKAAKNKAAAADTEGL